MHSNINTRRPTLHSNMTTPTGRRPNDNSSSRDSSSSRSTQITAPAAATHTPYTTHVLLLYTTASCTQHTPQQRSTSSWWCGARLGCFSRHSIRKLLGIPSPPIIFFFLARSYDGIDHPHHTTSTINTQHPATLHNTPQYHTPINTINATAYCRYSSPQDDCNSASLGTKSGAPLSIERKGSFAAYLMD